MWETNLRGLSGLQERQYSAQSLRNATCVDTASLSTDSFSSLLRFQQYCNNFADKYVEFDAIIIFVDLLLLRPQVFAQLQRGIAMLDDSPHDQVYRHLLFNRMKYRETGIDVSSCPCVTHE